MVHDFSSRAAARHLLAESDVVPSDELTEALTELKSLGERPVPPMSPALADAMRQAAAPAGQAAVPGRGASDNVVAFRFGRARRRGTAVGGAVLLAMAAGMGGVAAFGPDNAVGTAIDSVIRWVAPAERTEPVSDEQPAPARPELVPAPETPTATEPSVPGSSQNVPQPVESGDAVSPEAPAERESGAPAPRKGKSAAPVEQGREAVPPVELPELSVPIPDPVTTPRSVIPVDPPELSLPGGTPKTTPGAEPSR